MEQIKRFRLKRDAVLPSNLRDGGTWIHKNATHFISKTFTWPQRRLGEFSIGIAFTADWQNWNDFANVLVMDEEFGQPYTPFYHALETKLHTTTPALEYVIHTYNQFMSEQPYLVEVK